MNKILIALAVLMISGCASTVYKSEGSMLSKGSNNYSYAYIKNGINSTKMENDDTIKYDLKINQKNQKEATPDRYIIGDLLKRGISIITEDEYSLKRNGSVLSVEWVISGKNRKDILGSYSLEVAVLIRDASTGGLIYKGAGEGMGLTHEDDIRIATLAAIKNLTL